MPKRTLIGAAALLAALVAFAMTGEENCHDDPAKTDEAPQLIDGVWTLHECEQ